VVESLLIECTLSLHSARNLPLLTLLVKKLQDRIPPEDETIGMLRG
jgi:hypothetical protein